MKKSIRLLVFVAALALAAAACGADEPASSGAPVGGTDQTLPLNSGDDLAPDPAGACLEGEPDCNDTPGGTPSDLPPPQDTDLPVLGPAPDALSVS
ncbi:MAG: hypothetical protein OER12_01945, partial [Acidimicrobiia bacterium]|nr:hypothetical protein [Acidimicrobiia bacterium]